VPADDRVHHRGRQVAAHADVHSREIELEPALDEELLIDQAVERAAPIRRVELFARSPASALNVRS
jgi:hypothetical protein